MLYHLQRRSHHPLLPPINQHRLPETMSISFQTETENNPKCAVEKTLSVSIYTFAEWRKSQQTTQQEPDNIYDEAIPIDAIDDLKSGDCSDLALGRQMTDMIVIVAELSEKFFQPGGATLQHENRRIKGWYLPTHLIDGYGVNLAFNDLDLRIGLMNP